MELNEAKLEAFKSHIWEYYRKNRRDFPWRNTYDPYHILVSEVMLQQTQVSRVITKYTRFIARFPDFVALAHASTSQVLEVWSGMGYNRRALYLKRIAERVEKDLNGRLPSNPPELDALPGIGKATAASIAAFAYNIPTVFIETNIRRVFIHHFFPDRDEVGDGEILPLVEKTVDQANPREWYYALMDYGTYLAKQVENPNRKSRHYSIQSQFEGSDRQIRGKILRLLLKGGLSEERLIEEVGEEEGRVRRILRDLAKDGFIRAENNRYIID